MLLALALYASTAHANTPHCDLDLLYHDERAHRVASAPSIGFPRRGALSGEGRAVGASSSRHD